MKLDGMEIEKLSTAYLIKKRTEFLVLTVIMLCFAVGCLVMLPLMASTLTEDDGGFAGMMSMYFLVFGGILGYMAYYNGKKLITVDKELKTRKDYKKELTVAKENRKGNAKMIAIIAGAVLVLILLGKGCSALFGGSGSGGCTICGGSATHSFQGSSYCTSHYNDAVKWAIDHTD